MRTLTIMTLIAATLASGTWAQNLTAELRSSYYKLTRAANLRYLDGMVSLRAPEFVLFDQDGNRVDLAVERARAERYLAQSIALDERSELRQCQPVGPQRVRCRVRYQAQFRVLDSDGKAQPRVIQSECQDLWEKRRGKWWLLQTRVLSQTVRRGAGK